MSVAGAVSMRRRSRLRVAGGVDLGLDYVTKTAAILAQRRKGKTYLGCDLAEELAYAKMPWVALDPTGAWWGLRSSADGESAGLPVVVVGGQRGDLPLERQAGAAVADLVLDFPGWYVIDFSLLGSRAAEREFAATFGERLHRRKMEPGMDFPLHLFVDEADLFVPQEKETSWGQRRRPGDPPDVLAVYQGIVRRGGLHGLGTTLISQRPALVNKNALTQIDILFLLRLVAGQDQDAVYKNNVSRFLAKGDADALMATLATMPIGEGWVLEPGADPPLCERVRFRERHTFNSSATPKPGERRVEPRVLADVDLDRLRDRMTAAIERARDDDPVALRRRIRDLEAALKTADVPRARDGHYEARVAELEADLAAALARGLEVVEVPVVSEETIAATREVIEAVGALARQMHALPDFLAARAEPLTAALERASQPRPVQAAPRPPEPPPTRERVPEAAARPARPVPPPDGDGAGTATRPQLDILDALAWWRAVGVGCPSASQVAFVVRKHPRTKGFTNNLSSLSSGGLIERGPGSTMWLTDAGSELATAPAGPPSETDLRSLIYDQVGPTRARLLAAVIAAGDWVTMEDLAGELGYHPRSKGFTNNVSSLSGLDLLDRQPGRVRASDLCFLR